MNPCENCKIRPGGAILSYDMKHCATCGRDLFPLETNYAAVKAAFLALKKDGSGLTFSQEQAILAALK